MSHPTPESQTRNTTTTQPTSEERPSLPADVRRIEALRTQADAQHALGFRGRLI